MANAKTSSLNRKEQVAAAKLELSGLCLTCNYAETCVRREHHGKPVWYCEEFDDFQPESKGTVVREKRVASTETAMEAYKGLCLNCDNRQVCVIPKSEGGIWHCEEYS